VDLSVSLAGEEAEGLAGGAEGGAGGGGGGGGGGAGVGAAGDVTMPEVQLSAYAAGTSPLSTHGVVAEQYLQDAPNCQPAQGLSAERAAAHSAQHAAADAAGSRCVVLP
jgi:hypothetical protein